MNLSFVAAILSIALFIFLIRWMDVIPCSIDAITVSKAAMADLLDKTLSDEEKEATARRISLSLGRSFLVIGLRLIVACAVPLIVLRLLYASGALSFEAVLHESTSLKTLVVGALVSIAILAKKTGAPTPEPKYSSVEKALHRIAFRTYPMQVELAELEDKVLGKGLPRIRVDRSVFISGLPRAGTTLLLEILSASDEFAVHRYVDMPFIPIPLLWNLLSRSFRKTGMKTERAHGDGVMINAESPEAFEEVIWKAFWPQQYARDRILPWTDAHNPEFESFFETHLKKIIMLRRKGPEATPRYLSKNNANIGRTRYIENVLPDAKFVVPFRDVLQHASSLLNQHKRYLELHEKDPFAKTYMDGIAHFDFGTSLRPIDFNGWMNRSRYPDPLTLGFWVEYWQAAYSALLASAGRNTLFVNYDALCASPHREVARICEALSVGDRDSIMKSIRVVSSRPQHVADLSGLDENLRSAVNATMRELIQRATSR